MPELPDVTQKFVADVRQYVAAMKRAAEATQGLRDAIIEVNGMMGNLEGEAAKAAAVIRQQASATKDLNTEMLGGAAAAGAEDESFKELTRTAAFLNATFGLITQSSNEILLSSSRLMALNKSVAESFGNIRSSAVAASLTQKQLAQANENLADTFAPVVAMTRLEANQLRVLAEADLAAAAADEVLAQSMQDVREASHLAYESTAQFFTGTAAAVSKAGAAATTQGGMIAAWWRQWGAVVHWVVMGTLEIAATAIPALAALSAAAIAMYPTFVHISDVMHNLFIASGSLSGALANSVGPLRAMGQNAMILRQAVAPDAYIIFGAAINALTGHVGAFAGIAKQASDVLAAFATKLSAELAGPMGGQLILFFQGAVKFMIQWGQVLGNLGHTFVNVIHSMWGVSQVLLDALVLITRVLLDLTSSPAIAFFIGLTTAMSAAYRYGVLLKNIWIFLGGAAVVNMIRTLVTTFIALAAATSITDAALTMFAGLLVTIESLLMGPLGIALLAAAAGFAIFYLAADHVSSATANLIKNVEAAPKSVASLTNGVMVLERQLLAVAPTMKEIGAVAAHGGVQMVKAMTGSNADVKALTQAIAQQAGELVNLVTGYAQAGLRTGQVGAGMNALAVQTAIADSKVQQLNQAIDQYIGLLTGGTSAEAAFANSLSNITSVAATTGIANLGRSTATTTISVNRFSKALEGMGGRGAGAWQNFNQVVGSTMPQLLDWFRTVGVVVPGAGEAAGRAFLDMAKSLIPLASRSPVAQAELLGLGRSTGLNIRNFGQLRRMTDHAGVGMKDLTTLVGGLTIKLSDLSQLAQNVANVMNTQVTSAIAASSLNASGFNTALGKLQADMANRAPASTIHQDLLAVNADLRLAQQMGIAAGNGISKGAGNAAAAVKASAREQQQDWIAAKQAAQQYQAFIDSMHGKTLQIQTIYSASTAGGVGPGHPLPAPGGFHGMVAGMQHGGGFIGGMGGVDRHLAALTSGEAVLSRAAVTAMGAANVMALNARPSGDTLRVLGGGGSTGTIHLTLEVPVMLDGSRIGTTQRTQILTYNRRNPSNNIALRYR